MQIMQKIAGSRSVCTFLKMVRNGMYAYVRVRTSRQAATPPPRGSGARECSVLTFRPPARRPAWQETDPQETEPEVRKKGNTGMF